jgi:hypothetical protein
MKVTMQQTVDLEEVPLHVNRLLLQAIEQLESLAHIASSLDVTRSDEFVENLDFVRKRMFTIDTKFDECAGIMKSYRSTLEQLDQNNEIQPNQATVSPSIPTAEEPAEDTIKQYKDFVQKMPDSMDEIKSMYESLYKEKNLHTQNPIPPFPDLDLAGLNEKKSVLEELLKNE